MTLHAPGLWDAVDRLADRASRPEDLVTHRVHLLAARRWRAAGRAVPAALAADEQRARIAEVTAPALLQHVREAYDGPLVLMKGPEVAAWYPHGALRPFNDLDLLVPDLESAQRALLGAGFVPVGDARLYEGIHHERPLALPGLQLYVELHSTPKWPERLAPPSVEELFAATVPSSLGIAGLDTLAPAQHALVLAAHSWAHAPLRRLGDLIDVSLAVRAAGDADVQALARAWGLERIWATTAGAAAALFDGRPLTLPLRSWARHLPRLRDRTVFETHLEGWLAGFWAVPPPAALAAGAAALARELRPAPGETYGTKLARTRLALRNAGRRRSEHVDELERSELRAPHFYELDDADAIPPGGGE